jgi:hypothetical protein
MSRPIDPDLLTLAEDVHAGRPMTDAEARLATEPERTELRSLVRALAALSAHADATRAAPSVAAPVSLEVARGPVPRQPVRGRSNRPLVGGLALALTAVVVVGVIALSLGGPSPTGPAASSPAGSPSAEASAVATARLTPVPTLVATTGPTPVATSAPTTAPSMVAAEGLPLIESTPLAAPNLAFWTVEGESIQVLAWDPMASEMVEKAMVDTLTGGDIQRTLLFAPNGAHFAVHEINVTTSSPVQRVRIFGVAGDLVWTSPQNPRLPIVTRMAWSPDGSALAIGSLPVPWTVVQLSETGAQPDVTTYELDDQDGYALLGFSEDGNTLYGSGTGGEAEYWQKLVSVNRATGRLAPIDAIPPGPTALSWADSTGPVDRFHPDGSILIQPGLARGEPSWAARIPAGEDVPIAVDPSAQITWGPDRQVVSLGTDLRLDVIDPATGEAAAAPGYAFPDGDYRAQLRGARDDFALVLLGPTPEGEVKEAVIVELSSGRAAVGLPPADLGRGALGFAGWLGRRD